MPATIDPTTSVAELVLARPSAARVLAWHGLDYCCAGARSLREACAERGLDAATVARLLERAGEPVALEHADWLRAPLAELCAHVVDVHHARLRWELPRLTELAERAAGAHGDDRPELHELHDVLARVRAVLEPHAAREEALFPKLARGAAIDAAERQRLEREHEAAGALLRRLRALSGGFATADALCATHRALLEGLHGLELDLHQQVHEENNVLFPRAAATR